VLAHARTPTRSPSPAQLTPGGAATGIGTFDTHSGGERSATDTKHRPGGSADEISYGGPASRGNVTLSRVFDAVKGDTALYKKLDTMVGRARVSSRSSRSTRT
jgi:hypothetical protein